MKNANAGRETRARLEPRSMSVLKWRTLQILKQVQNDIFDVFGKLSRRIFFRHFRMKPKGGTAESWAIDLSI